MLCKHEVVGSIPSGSTSFELASVHCIEDNVIRLARAGGDLYIVKRRYACCAGRLSALLARARRHLTAASVWVYLD